MWGGGGLLVRLSVTDYSVYPHTGGELFALLEREGVFLEDTARLDNTCV